MKRDKAYLKKVMFNDMAEEDYYQRTDKKSKSIKNKTKPKSQKNNRDWDNEDSQWK